MKDKQVIEPKDVGSLEDVLGPGDPLFQPEPKQEEEEKETTDEQKRKQKGTKMTSDQVIQIRQLLDRAIVRLSVTNTESECIIRQALALLPPGA